MKCIKQNTVVLCSLLFFLFILVDTAAGDECVSRPESAEEMEWPRQNLEEEIDLRKKAQAAIDAKIPLAEKDPYNPVFHFRPPAQWMNDICGAIFYKLKAIGAIRFPLQGAQIGLIESVGIKYSDFPCKLYVQIARCWE